ncbi:hypothetical protein ACGFZS_22045 [Streptomyces sp. NPDC048288]|uniref:hypothetical protein n=1 Tax=Streptomyces sp. NPDC048288 TaxID=3365529 RepID=UPI00371BDBEF
MRDFPDASQKREVDEQRREKRRVRRLRLAVIALSTLLAITMTASYLAITMRERTIEKQTEAKARKLEVEIASEMANADVWCSASGDCAVIGGPPDQSDVQLPEDH